jgi:hypothetical protein
MLDSYAKRIAAESGVGRVPPYIWGEISRAEGNAHRFGQDIGLDPAGRAKLAKDFGVAHHLGGDPLAELHAKGAAILARRRAARAELAAGESGVADAGE